MPDQIKAVVIRQSRDENTVAIVTCDKCRHVINPNSMHRGIYEAVTEWIFTTNEGLETLESNNDNFNIGDLTDNLTESKLAALLKKHCIFNFKIETHCTENPIGWDFDDQIFDVSRIPD